MTCAFTGRLAVGGGPEPSFAPFKPSIAHHVSAGQRRFSQPREVAGNIRGTDNPAVPRASVALFLGPNRPGRRRPGARGRLPPARECGRGPASAQSSLRVRRRNGERYSRRTARSESGEPGSPGRTVRVEEAAGGQSQEPPAIQFPLQANSLPRLQSPGDGRAGIEGTCPSLLGTHPPRSVCLRGCPLTLFREAVTSRWAVLS